MPTVFTIYNCGTSHNRQNLDETVADLARRTVESENRDWMINDGPGSYSHPASSSAPASARGLAVQAKTPGTRDPISGLKEIAPFAVLRGVVDGFGWNENVAHVMVVLGATIDLPQTINMVGWSRGAITCFMIAHALAKNPRTSSIPVNIFAFDPVPGPGNFDDPDKVTLPANVQAYAAVVQEDERRKIFRPALIDPEEVSGVKARFYCMPGGHATGVFRIKTEVGLIGAFLAHRFLQKHGTQLNNPISLTARDLCELYAKIRMEIGHYRDSGGGMLTFLGLQRRVVANRFQDTAYFINDHHANQFHANQFRKTLPQIWCALDRGINSAGQATFQSALRFLRNSAPTTFQSLQQVGILS